MEYERNTYGYIAKKDLVSATASLSVKAVDPVCLYMQQALEKIMKHYLTLVYEGNDLGDLLRSHKLLRLAGKTGLPELQKYRETLRFLGDYYFEGRYPNVDYEEADWNVAQKSYEEGSKVFEIVEAAIQARERKFCGDLFLHLGL